MRRSMVAVLLVGVMAACGALDVPPIACTQVETEFEPGQPNRAGCPPVCWRAIVRL